MTVNRYFGSHSRRHQPGCGFVSRPHNVTRAACPIRALDVSTIGVRAGRAFFLVPPVVFRVLPINVWPSRLRFDGFFCRRALMPARAGRGIHDRDTTLMMPLSSLTSISKGPQPEKFRPWSGFMPGSVNALHAYKSYADAPVSLALKVAFSIRSLSSTGYDVFGADGLHNVAQPPFRIWYHVSVPRLLFPADKALAQETPQGDWGQERQPATEGAGSRPTQTIGHAERGSCSFSLRRPRDHFRGRVIYLLYNGEGRFQGEN